MRDWFARTAMRVADLMGSPWAFLIAATCVVAWAILGPVFGFSNTWQLVINTGTTIVTFLMVFTHPEHPESRIACDAAQAGRADPGRRAG